MLPTYRAWAIAAAAALATGCGEDGAVRLMFDVPANPALSPAGPQLSEITLVSWLPGETPQAETRLVGDRSQPLDMGRVDVADQIQLAVEMRSATQRLVGYGRSPGPITVRADAVTDVPINVRRPFVYATGSTAIATFDSTLDLRFESYGGSIATQASPRVVVPTPDGAHLVVGVAAGNGGQIFRIESATHAAAPGAPINLSLPPVDIAVASNNRIAVVAHNGAGGGVSLVDLDSGAVQFVAIGSVDVVVISQGEEPDGAERAFALLDRTVLDGCGGNASTIIGVPLDDPTTLGPTISYDAPLRDLAGSRDSRQLVVADGCNNRLFRMDPDDDAQRSELSRVLNASAVAILDGRVWGVGTIPAAGNIGARLLIVSIGLAGQDEVRVELDETKDQAVALDFTTTGQQALQQMGADQLTALDLAIGPGGDHIALLTRAHYEGEEFVDFIFGVLLPEMTMDTYEYLLIDTASTQAVQRLRMWCDLWWDSGSGPYLDRWECASAPDQDAIDPQSPQAYIPDQISVLYGAR